MRLASLTLQPDRRDAIAGMDETEAGDLAEWFVDAAAVIAANGAGENVVPICAAPGREP